MPGCEKRGVGSGVTGEEWNNWREEIGMFTLHTATRIGAGPGGSQEPRTPPGSGLWVAEALSTEDHLLSLSISRDSRRQLPQASSCSGEFSTYVEEAALWWR